jgi:type IV secretory pathway protease TraF
VQKQKQRFALMGGEPLPPWQGCTSMNEGQVLMLCDTAGSYDGRYFGVTRASEIIGRVDLLLMF